MNVKNPMFVKGAKVLLTLVLVMPILGVLGIFPAPTRELYSSSQAFLFIQQS